MVSICIQFCYLFFYSISFIIFSYKCFCPGLRVVVKNSESTYANIPVQARAGNYFVGSSKASTFDSFSPPHKFAETRITTPVSLSPTRGCEPKRRMSVLSRTSASKTKSSVLDLDQSDSSPSAAMGPSTFSLLDMLETNLGLHLSEGIRFSIPRESQGLSGGARST